MDYLGVVAEEEVLNYIFVVLPREVMSYALKVKCTLLCCLDINDVFVLHVW